MLEKSLSISAIVPVYQSEAMLEALYKRLMTELGYIVDSFEIILVEDGSRDKSWQVIQELAHRDHRVRGVRMSRNYGQHNALLCGIRAARNEIIVTLDDDLQNPPDEIGKLLEKLQEGYDVVYGTPKKEQHGLLRDLASRITKIVLQSTMGASTAKQISAFRAFRTELRGAFMDYRSPYVNIDVLLTWATNRFSAVKVCHAVRSQGSSGYGLYKLVRHTLNMVTGFTTLPLRLASILGFFFSVFGLAILAYVLVRYIALGTEVPGFTFLASIVAIFSGTQMFALGIIGEYLSRMHIRMMDRPAYFVKETTEADIIDIENRL